MRPPEPDPLRVDDKNGWPLIETYIFKRVDIEALLLVLVIEEVLLVVVLLVGLLVLALAVSIMHYNGLWQET